MPAEQISSDDLWVDGILENSIKAMLGNNFVNKSERYFDYDNNFLGGFLT